MALSPQTLRARPAQDSAFAAPSASQGSPVSGLTPDSVTVCRGGSASPPDLKLVTPQDLDVLSLCTCLLMRCVWLREQKWPQEYHTETRGDQTHMVIHKLFPCLPL